MKKNIMNIFIALAMVLIGYVSYAQDNSDKEVMACCDKTESNAFEDPLIPQTFAVDSKTQAMVVIDTPENTIAIMSRTTSGYEMSSTFLIDVVKGRHDIHFIYKPKSIALYDNNIVFLASNRDSSYIGVLNMQGEVVKMTNKFAGAASAFSYDKIHKRLYVAGLNPSGFNVFDIDVSKGFANINIDTVSTDNAAYKIYSIPRKADEIKQHDPYGLGLTMIAMGTVFAALIIISIILMGFAKGLMLSQQRKKNKSTATAETSVDTTPTKDLSTDKKYISGDEFAAIAAAIYMYNEELHDEENTVLTITEVNRRYSPWSSKMHNMNVYRRR
ncbi:MAG: OadG family protein [Bacteroidales bacterium]|nr:OadG family protein [Bacteroidales bacterium]